MMRTMEKRYWARDQIERRMRGGGGIHFFGGVGEGETEGGEEGVGVGGMWDSR